MVQEPEEPTPHAQAHDDQRQADPCVSQTEPVIGPVVQDDEKAQGIHVDVVAWPRE
jgi:hypothetical protein